MDKHFTKVISKMNLNKYTKLNKNEFDILDKKAEKIENIELLSNWKDKQIRDWVGLWYNSTFIYDKSSFKYGFKGWLNNWEIKLMNTCNYKKNDISNLRKFAILLDNLDCQDSECLDRSKECKQFIIKMIELLGFRSLMCIGI